MWKVEGGLDLQGIPDLLLVSRWLVSRLCIKDVVDLNFA